MWDCICELLAPTATSVIRRLGTLNVCTATQCFDSETDAFGLAPVTVSRSSALLFYVLSMLFATAILSKHVSQGKPRRIEVSQGPS